ncbi:hypothetical protein [Macrococcus sp. DPC7161]|uniref:hypothetical protein n=1 Tax=Macrococcus sp. DPC7161 TaxID=2507060 RepID=UPI00100B75F2|nr:hypothetical protein [Macrococcus sp. DPC7161]RXK18926.1 hypothetical protein ER639_01050 [Macrococcus sp. DPC7161]
MRPNSSDDKSNINNDEINKPAVKRGKVIKLDGKIESMESFLKELEEACEEFNKVEMKGDE